MYFRLTRNALVLSIALALWTAESLASESSDGGNAAGVDQANVDRQAVYTTPAFPTFIEPGPMTTAVLHRDGSVIEVGSETRWRPVCGSPPGMTQEDFMRMIEPARKALREADDPQDPLAEGGGLNVIFSVSGGAPAGATTALEAVAQYIEGTFTDNVSFTITIQFQNLGGGGTLGFASSSYRIGVSYGSAVRPGLQNGMDSDDTIQAFLPTGSSCPVRYSGASDTVTSEFATDITIANFRAAIGSTAGTAATIVFNTATAWDYDPSNGISGGQFDFQSVVAHEVGHAMGFTSNVDNQTQDMEMLDLFRFQSSDGCCDYNPDTEAEFQTAPRLVSFNSPDNQHICDIIASQYFMSDGAPDQASHFHTTVSALMDPNLAPGESFFPNFFRTPDIDLFDAIGWDYPPCVDPCNDFDVCTDSEVCVGQTCVGTPVDCSVAGGDCNSAACDPGGGEGNCDTLTPVNEGGLCDGGIGVCQSGICVPDPGITRVFMTRPGFEGSEPTSGSTTIFMAQGTSAIIEVWVADTEAQLLGNYQMSMAASATPEVGATGTIDYVDNFDPSGCDSLLVDVTDPDWVFFNEQPTPFCSETGLPDGVAFVANLNLGEGLAVTGLKYLGEFQFAASAAALGTFTLDFIPFGLPPNGGSFMVDETGIGPIFATYQPLSIVVSATLDCTTAADCADVAPMDGATDDVCIWWECVAGTCNGIPKTFPSDMGGAFGACPIDGFCNLADALHALTCFSGDNGCDAINIDAGGAFGACPPDGFCNLSDALHALTCFAGDNACSCLPSPDAASEPNIVGAVSLEMVADRRAIKPGAEVQVRVFIDGALPNLRAYQLDTAVSGGRRGDLELVDIAIEGRADYVFAGASVDAFDAFNVTRGQMLSGLFTGDVETHRGGYLATFTYRASDDAVGTFVIDVMHDEPDRDQTFLVGVEQTDKIDVSGTAPAVITVTRDSARTIR